MGSEERSGEPGGSQWRRRSEAHRQKDVLYPRCQRSEYLLDRRFSSIVASTRELIMRSYRRL